MTNSIQRIWTAIKAVFEAEATWPDLAATEPISRAIGWDQISEQVWSAVHDIYMDCYPWITGFYQDGGETFVVISHEGKLYKHMLTIAADTVTVGPGEPVTVEFPAAGGAAEAETVRSSITIHRQADGRIRGVGIVATSVLNRVGEIDSRQLFDSFVEHWKENGDNPILEFYHLGETSRLGEIDYLARDENIYINSWLFDDNAIGRAAADSLENDSDYWGFSIGYLPTCAPEMMRVADGVDIPVYTVGVQRETSIVAEKRAANLFTMPITGVERMNKDIKEDLKKLLGGDEELTNEAEALIDTRNRAIEEQGLVTRADGDDTPEGETLTITDPEGDETTATAEVGEIELDDEAVGAIVQAIQNGEQFAALTASVASLTETVTQLATAMEAQTRTANTAAAEINRRLQALEGDEDIRREDMPGNRSLKVTYRPRVNGGQRAIGATPDGDDQPSMADIAAETLQKIPGRY